MIEQTICVDHLTGIGSTTWHEFARMIFEKVAPLWNKPLVVTLSALGLSG